MEQTHSASGKDSAKQPNKISRKHDKEVDKICCICDKPFKGFGNNPDPIKEKGRCCDSCNGLVVFARIAQMRSNP